MENEERRGFSLHEGIKIADFMKNAKYGDVVELTDCEGNTSEFTFEAAVIRGKDLCHYIRLNRGGVALTLIANFKHNKFFALLC